MIEIKILIKFVHKTITLRTLTFADTRLENKVMLDVLDALLPYGQELYNLNLANAFVFFHHLLREERDRFDWIVYSRVNSITNLMTGSNIQ